MQRCDGTTEVYLPCYKMANNHPIKKDLASWRCSDQPVNRGGGRHSPDPTKRAPGTVGTCPVPAGAGRAAAVKWDWVSSPAASGAGAGTCCSLRGVTDLFSSLPGAHLALALPLSLAGDETRCSCEAGAETLEACEDTRGGKRSWSSSWRSWLPQSASQVAQLTPLPPTPAPVFDLSDRQGALSMLEGGKGLMEAPWGSHGWVHMRHSSFSLLGFSKRDVHLICSPPPPARGLLSYLTTLWLLTNP